MKIGGFVYLILVFFFFADVKAQKTVQYKVAQTEITNAAGFDPFEEIKKVSPCRKSFKDCAFEAMAVHGMEGFGGPEEIYFFEHQFRYKKNGKDVGVFVFSILNREEPVSSDERTRVEFIRENGRWKFVTIGNQTRCINGKKITGWSKEPCN